MTMILPRGEEKKELSNGLIDMIVEKAITAYNNMNVKPERSTIIYQTKISAKADSIHFSVRQIDNSLKRLVSSKRVEKEKVKPKNSERKIVVYKTVVKLNESIVLEIGTGKHITME